MSEAVNSKSVCNYYKLRGIILYSLIRIGLSLTYFLLPLAIF